MAREEEGGHGGPGEAEEGAVPELPGGVYVFQLQFQYQGFPTANSSP